ncbi:MAG: N-6 DNA methylase [Ignavibacteria bacterium]|nr:N-6 DNA methylase [Ignavibacteria bacterium]
MTSAEEIQAYPDELPSNFADRLGEMYSKKVSAEHKKGNGQYFTPIPISGLMASFCRTRKKNLKILDPGCGAGILACSLVEHLTLNSESEKLDLVAYETDSELIRYTYASLSYLKKWLEKRNIVLNYIIFVEDFVLHNALTISNNHKDTEKFDIIITNPPYFKISKDDIRTKAAAELVSGHANIYSIFIGLSINLLLDEGQIIFITPRSFASGNYFRAFRQHFFSLIQVKNIHLFGSRTSTFDRDKVLQETVIISALKEKILPGSEIIVSSSNGIKDINNSIRHCLPAKSLVDLDSREKMLHLPINEKEISILELTSNWNNKLIDYSIQISTGPVVSHRAGLYISEKSENGIDNLVPLYWLHNVTKMHISWPLEYKNKEQYIKVVPESLPLLVRSKNYVFLRRFSTKDDKSRLIAAPYFPLAEGSGYIGIENKLNYIYKINGELENNEVMGISALLNSELFDTYFQIFNGNVNVSATEIREMKMPSIDVIREIGDEIIYSNDLTMKNINRYINNFFEIESIMV